MFKRRTSKILEKYQYREILKQEIGANFFGQESLGLKQIRGNGVLLLLAGELIFEMWFPRRTFTIFLADIRSIERAKKHLRKNILRPLLKVVFLNNNGQTDSMAWWVRDVDDWIFKLREERE
jgi:hypothetical protein